MRAIYEKILSRMQADGFRVFQKRYRLSKAEKLLLLVYFRFCPLGLGYQQARRDYLIQPVHMKGQSAPLAPLEGPLPQADPPQGPQ